jgi:response regulator RpfG family c-di-GMP phosphodiesterase
MKEMIIVADENRFDVAWLIRCLRDEGYSSIPCETMEEAVKELNTLPNCGVNVPLVVIQPGILRNISEDVVNRLSECAPEVPFILLDQENSPETFERICANRVQFEWEGNPLAKTLQCACVELACG